MGFLFLLNNCFAQDLPETPAGTRTQEIVDILNGTSSYEPEDYINNQYTPDFRDAFPIATHKSIFQMTKTMFGKVKVVDVSKTTENEIYAVLESEKGDAWLDLNLQVEPEDPHRIMSMSLAPGSRPAGMKAIEKTQTGDEESVAGLEDNEELLFSNLKQLKRYLVNKTKENKFSGTVLIAKDGKPVFHKAYGYASKRYKVPNKKDTKFNLGSLNKMFTTVAIAQLMEKGKLSIDDPIGKYLDIFPPEIARKVTIRHLINMRSGWGDYWGNEYFLSHKDNLRTVSDYMEFIKNIPLDFEPGTNFQHCNTGFEVAGAIIEKISGMDYFDYVKKNIYEPSGMTNTDSYHRDSPVENLAMGYTNMNRNDLQGEGCNWNNMFMMPPRGTPSGGGYSTAEDLLKYDIALRSHKLLSPEYTNFLLNSFKGALEDPLTPNKMFRGAGAAPGICAFLAFDFQTSYSIIVLSNIDYPEAMIIGEGIIKMLEIE
ncbi:MAG: beta-lactamase family protein [Bacteroidales bacterium]|nr:beta-lactamase family protein [Bacteroidales bacterium]